MTNKNFHSHLDHRRNDFAYRWKCVGLFESQGRESQEGASYSDHHGVFHAVHTLRGLYAAPETVIQEL